MSIEKITKILFHSHNDYWNENQVYEAWDNGCSIIGIGVIYYKGDVMLSRSWKPWRFLMYGKAENYFQIMKTYSGKEKIYLYIELKTDDYKIVTKLKKLMLDNKNENVTYLLGGKKDTGKEKIAKEIYRQTLTRCNVKLWSDIIKDKTIDIERIELYKNKSWLKRLNHF